MTKFHPDLKLGRHLSTIEKEKNYLEFPTVKYSKAILTEIYEITCYRIA